MDGAFISLNGWGVYDLSLTEAKVLMRSVGQCLVHTNNICFLCCFFLVNKTLYIMQSL